MSTSKTLKDQYNRVNHLEKDFANAINEGRFIPYIQLHEFEALLFCEIEIYLTNKKTLQRQMLPFAAFFTMK